MPGKLLDEYRERFAEFSAALNREKYLYRSGRKAACEAARIEADFSDLFTRAAADELRAAFEATDGYRETEREAIKLLIAAAVGGHLRSRVRELTEEIEAYEARAAVEWQGREVGFREAGVLLAAEPDASKRRDLAARRAEVVKGAEDLRAERLEKMHAEAGALGHENYAALLGELDGVDYARLAAEVAPLLARTESGYVSALAPLLARDAGVSLDDATEADLGRLTRLAEFDQFFPPALLRRVYAETFAGLGIKVEKQPNVELDDEWRPGKRGDGFCAPVRVPDEIKLVINPTGGQADYQVLLREAGRAERFAWTSRGLHPEFRYGGDEATLDCFAFLFNYLVHDEAWLADQLGFTGAGGFLHRLAVHKLLAVRCAAARLTYGVELHSGRLAAGAGARYAELLTDAARVRYGEAGYLRDAGDSMRSAARLRAWAFESQLREYLKTKYGARWWTSRKAGEVLIDLWNTGGRYKAEEMAKLIGLGDLSFDWLASELLRQIGPRHLKTHS
jgi:hypothetical protein